MLAQEHAEKVGRMMAEADRNFDSDYLYDGAEHLWGAVTYLLHLAAKERGWPEYHGFDLWKTVNGLAEELEDPGITAGFSTAEYFGHEFLLEFIDDRGYEDDLEDARDFVDLLLVRSGTPDNPIAPLQTPAGKVRRRMAAADRWFATRRLHQGGHHLWMAATYLLHLAAKERGWPVAGGENLQRAVQGLADEWNEPRLLPGYQAVLNFLFDASLKAMRKQGHEAELEKARQFIDILLERVA